MSGSHFKPHTLESALLLKLHNQLEYIVTDQWPCTWITVGSTCVEVWGYISATIPTWHLTLFTLRPVHWSTWTAGAPNSKAFLCHQCSGLVSLAEDAACLSPSSQPSPSSLLPLHFCLVASAPSTVNCQTCYCAVSCLSLLLTKSLGLMSCWPFQ